MTGENFKRINRQSNAGLKETLAKANEAFTLYANLKSVTEEAFSYDKMHKLEREAKIAEYELYCAEYEDNRRRNWN